MTDTAHPVQPGPTSIGELLSNAFRMYRGEPMMFILLTAITVIPVGLLSAIASNAVTVSLAATSLSGLDIDV